MNQQIATVTGPASPQPRPAGVITASRVFIGRSLRHSLRDGEGLIMAIALPVILMLLFTVVFGGAILGSDYVDYVVPGVVVLCASYGASSTAVAVNRDVSLGAMRRFRTLPSPPVTVLVGHVVASLLRNLVATAAVIGVAFAIGFRPSAGLAEWTAALGLITVWILAITLLFAFIGLISSSPEAANGYGFFLLFLPYLSGAFVPIATMPSWLQPVATYQPVNPLTDALRSLLHAAAPAPDATAPYAALVAVAWCLGIIAVSLALIAWRFPRLKDR
ncbi:MAG: ABC transporter permease [Galactobacter sp.]